MKTSTKITIGIACFLTITTTGLVIAKTLIAHSDLPEPIVTASSFNFPRIIGRVGVPISKARKACDDRVIDEARDMIIAIYIKAEESKNTEELQSVVLKWKELQKQLIAISDKQCSGY
jgi:hypothetical protein